MNFFNQQPQQQPIWAGGQGMGAGMGGMMRGLPQQPPVPQMQQQPPLPIGVTPQQGGGDGDTTLNTSGLTPATQRTDAEVFAGLNPAAGDVVKDSLLGSAKSALAKNALNTGLKYAITDDLNLGGLLNPEGLMGAIPKAMVSSMGFEAPKNIGGFLASKLPSALGMALGGGLPGVALGMMGTPFADMMGDAFGFRSADPARDKLEDASGELRGRRQYRDAMKQHGIKKAEIADVMENFKDAAVEAQKRYDTAYQLGNFQDLQRLKSEVDMYTMLDNIIGYQNRVKQAKSDGSYGDESRSIANQGVSVTEQQLRDFERRRQQSGNSDGGRSWGGATASDHGGAGVSGGYGSGTAYK